MANLYLSNTSGQIDLTIRCSYLNLINSRSGPIAECSSSNPNSGFLIQDGNKNSGIYVGNCSLQSFKNKIDFKENSSIYLISPDDAGFFIGNTGGLNNSGLSYHFSGNNFSIGSGINTSFNGIQLNQSCPSLILKNTGLQNEQSILFYNGSDVTFLLSHCLNFLSISGSGSLNLKSKNKDSICIDGNSVSFSGTPLTNYSLSNYGKTYLGDQALISGALCVSTIGELNGLDINSRSIFKNTATFCSGVDICNNCLITTNCISGTTGYFDKIILANDIIYSNQNQCFRSLSITGSSIDKNYISGLTCFYDGLENTGISRLCSVIFSCATGQGLFLTGGNIDLSGNFNVSGGLKICQTTTQNVDNVILGCTFTVRATGNGFSQSFLGNVCWSGNISATGSGVFNNICTSGLANSLNSFNGCVCLCTPNSFICTPNLCASSIVCGSCIIGNNFISGTSGVFGFISQTGGSAISCFSSSGLHIGTNCTGYIKAANVAKAWGVFSLNNGVPTLLTGYNVCGITIPITGIAASGALGSLKYFPTGNLTSGQWNNPYVMYGLALNETIKAPFTFNLQFHPVGCFDAFAGVRTGYLSTTTTTEMSGYLRTGFGGVSGFGYYSGSSGNVAGLTSGIISTGLANGSSGLAASWGPLGSYACSVQIPMFSTLVNCAGKNISSIGNYTTGNFEKIICGNNYGEIIFNLLPACMTLSSRSYYSIGNNSLNGTGTFTIFGY